MSRRRWAIAYKKRILDHNSPARCSHVVLGLYINVGNSDTYSLTYFITMVGKRGKKSLCHKSETKYVQLRMVAYVIIPLSTCQTYLSTGMNLSWYDCLTPSAQRCTSHPFMMAYKCVTIVTNYDSFVSNMLKFKHINKLGHTMLNKQLSYMIFIPCRSCRSTYCFKHFCHKEPQGGICLFPFVNDGPVYPILK